MQKFIFSIFTLLWGSQAFAQIDYDEYKSVSNKLFVKDVIIHTDHNNVIEYGSILINDGIIENVGKGISPPFDAITIDADSMHVYAAFIDALSNTGMKAAEEKDEKPDVKFPGNPPDEVAGVTPYKEAFKVLGKSGIKEMREAGFGISHVAPIGRMLPGQTCIISLSDKPMQEKLIATNHAMFSQLKSAPRVFPGTMIGVLTKWKELYKQAEGAIKHQNAFKLSNNGMQRPAYSESVNAFIPIVNKEQSVYFKAHKAKDIHRVLTLQKNLGFNLVLTDVAQAFPVIDKIKSANIAVLMSLEIPEKEEEKEKEDKEESAEVEKVDLEMEALKKRKAMAYDNYINQVDLLSKNNIQFGFSWLEAKPKDLHKNIRTLIENGLSKENALKALTTTPARILGISNIAGSVQKGKIANLMISTTDYFDEKAKIKFMIVDGELHEYEVKEKKKKANAGEAVDIVGTWRYEAKIPGNETTGKMVVKKSGDDYEIEFFSDDDPNDPSTAEDVEFDGTNLTYGFMISEEGFSMDISVDVDFTENEFEGTISAGDFGSFPMEGTRENPE